MMHQLWTDFWMPQSILFVTAFFISMFQYHFKARRHMLMTKFISDSLSASYYILMHATSGGIGAAIAATGALVQAMTPDKWMRKSRYYRAGGAIFLATLGIIFSKHNLANLLPLLSVIGARFFELSTSPQKIRVGMWLTFVPWIVYNIYCGLYLPVIANIIVLISLSWAIWTHHRIKIAPEPM